VQSFVPPDRSTVHRLLCRSGCLFDADSVDGVVPVQFLASAHVRVAEGTHDTVLADVERVLARHLGSACHTTIQVTARRQCCIAGDDAAIDGVGV
jgi:hypothetical protein